MAEQANSVNYFFELYICPSERKALHRFSHVIGFLQIRSILNLSYLPDTYSIEYSLLLRFFQAVEESTESSIIALLFSAAVTMK